MWFRFKLRLTVWWYRLRGKKHPLDKMREIDPFIYEE